MHFPKEVPSIVEKIEESGLFSRHEMLLKVKCCPSLNIFCDNTVKAKSNIAQQKENWSFLGLFSLSGLKSIKTRETSYVYMAHQFIPYDMCSNIKIILWRQICQKQLSFIRGFAHKLQQSVVGVRNYEEDGANSKLRI